MTPAAEIARLRQGLYRFFGGALATPGQLPLADLEAAVDFLEAMDIADYSFYREWRAFAAVLDSNIAVADLAPEYVRLFASGTKGILCPPIESYYRSEGRQEAIADIVTAIAADYRQMGITTTAAAESPDHVITQLEIMSTLCAQESAAWEMELLVDSDKLLDAEAEFLGRHLATWLPLLRTRVHAAGPNDYYGALLDAVHAFVVHDTALIPGLRRWAGAVA